MQPHEVSVEVIKYNTSGIPSFPLSSYGDNPSA